MQDLELKKDFYQQKRDAEDRYEEAMENQKIKKIPYSVLLGKFKQKESLREWQSKNKKLEEKVAKGTHTLHQWNLSKPAEQRYRSDSDNYKIIQQFTQQKNQPEGMQPKVSGFGGEQENFLNNFQLKRN